MFQLKIFKLAFNAVPKRSQNSLFLFTTIVLRNNRIMDNPYFHQDKCSPFTLKISFLSISENNNIKKIIKYFKENNLIKIRYKQDIKNYCIISNSFNFQNRRINIKRKNIMKMANKPITYLIIVIELTVINYRKVKINNKSQKR